MVAISQRSVRVVRRRWAQGHLAVVEGFDVGTSRGVVAGEGRIAPWGPRVEPPTDCGHLRRIEAVGLRATRTDLNK